MRRVEENKSIAIGFKIRVSVMQLQPVHIILAVPTLIPLNRLLIKDLQLSDLYIVSTKVGYQDKRDRCGYGLVNP